MKDVSIGEGKLAGKGIYANRDFSPGEVVIRYSLQPLSKAEFDILPRSEKNVYSYPSWSNSLIFRA